MTIVIGTTPTIRCKFNTIQPTDLHTAILTVRDRAKVIKLEKTLDTATIGDKYIEWNLSQEETLVLKSSNGLTMMCNWVTTSGKRGVSPMYNVLMGDNHIPEVIT